MIVCAGSGSALTYGQGDKLKATFGNVVAILTNVEGYAGTLSLNRMSATSEHAGVAMPDESFSAIRVDLERRYAIAPGEENVVKAVALVAAQRPYHPVERYLRSLVWDGEPRIARVATELLGVQIGEEDAGQIGIYNAMIRKFMISAVARAIRPGCKVDNMLVLTGQQGKGKSTWLRTLGGQWFTDTQVSIDSKDAYLTLGATWIWEWAELDTLTRATAERVKAFLSSSEDAFRAPYGRGIIRVKRSAVAVGTTNSDAFLKDPTGSRRFWIIPSGTINIERTAAWRDHLWAEAVAAFDAGETWWLTSAEDDRRAEDASAYEEVDPWEQPIGEHVAKLSTMFTTNDVLLILGMKRHEMKRADENRAAGILRRLGFERDANPRTLDGGRVRCWHPKRAG